MTYTKQHAAATNVTWVRLLLRFQLNPAIEQARPRERRMNSIFEPLARRNIVKTATTYAFAGWVLFASSVTLGQSGDEASSPMRWVGTWSASPQLPHSRLPPVNLNDQTLRQIVHISVGGKSLRLRLSNVFGQNPLTIRAASVGVRSEDASVVKGSLHQLTFAGHTSIVIPSGARVLSDSVPLTVDDGADLAVSIYVPGEITPTTTHARALQTSYVSPGGNFTDRVAMPVDKTVTSWFWLSGVDVMANADSRAVVVFGDSITDGTDSTVDSNSRYPDILARRLVERFQGADRVSVLNAGISGNRILTDVRGPNALARFDRDVLTQSGVAYVIILEGINDFGFSELDPSNWPPSMQLTDVSAAELITGISQMIVRARGRGLKVFGGTILPFRDVGYFSEGGEKKRQIVNEWIRTSDAFDGVIDFDAALRDPTDPERLLPDYDSGDNLHPNDAGYAAMAETIELSIFQR